MSRTVAETLDPAVAAAFVRAVLEQMEPEAADRLLEQLTAERREKCLDRLIDRPEVWHGWYSRQQAAACGVILYARSDGSTVAVTMVTREAEHGSRFPDMEPVGEVVEYVRWLCGPSNHTGAA